MFPFTKCLSSNFYPHRKISYFNNLTNHLMIVGKFDSITNFKIGDRVKFTDNPKMVGNIVKLTEFSVWIKN